jgi:heme/copper-type cytochrome/quinol oxidase subunit 2
MDRILGYWADQKAAVENLTKGNEVLEAAAENQKKSMKCICWIAILIAAVVVAFVFIIVWKTVWIQKDEPSPTTIPHWTRSNHFCQ